MRDLRTAEIEFSALTRNGKYIPLGFNVENLLRLWMVREPAVLTDINLHLKLMAAEIISLRSKHHKVSEQMQKMESRLEDVEIQAAKHHAQVDACSEEQTWADEAEDPSSTSPKQRGSGEQRTAPRQSPDQIAAMLQQPATEEQSAAAEQMPPGDGMRRLDSFPPGRTFILEEQSDDERVIRDMCPQGHIAADRGRPESPMMTGHLQQDPSNREEHWPAYG